MYYGTPCKAAEPYVGMIVKRRSRSGAVDDHLDAHGHALPRTASSSLTKPRHDSIKWCIDALMNEAEMPHECEVFNLFAAFVRQDGDQERTLQGLVPDFMYQRDPPHRTLGDVKCISVCKSWYSDARMNARCGAVSARQQRVTPEYIGKARRADRTYNGIRRNDVGPLEAEVKRHGRIDGLVFGAYGEASSDVEQLVQKIAAGSAQRHWRGMGARDVMEAKSILIARARKWLGVEAVRGHAMLKLDRLRQVVGGNFDNAQRRRCASRAAWWQRRQAY